MKYTKFEIDRMIGSMVILVDTREQATHKFIRRTEGFGYPFERKCLPYGDYSVRFVDLSGESVSLENIVSIERKMSADEVCMGFTKERIRFEREFERAKADGAKIYLLIENENWEKIITGKYKSKLNPKALKASLIAWTARYNMHIFYCKEETTGSMIRDILYYELKEYLRNGGDKNGKKEND